MPRKPEPIPGLTIKPAPDDAPVLCWIDPHSITPNDANWRLHPDDQKSLVGDAIDDPEIRWAGVCLYNRRTNEFIDGHLRREHAIGAGLDRIPVLVGDWSPEKQASIHTLLDMSAGMAKPDIPKLLALCRRAAPPSDRAGDIMRRLAEKQGVTFPESEAPDDGDGESDPESGDDGPSAADKIEASRAKWGCEPGQVWGFESADGRKHRVAIGDSSHDDTIARLFGSSKADLIVTSPPYDNQRDYTGDLPPWDEMMNGVCGALPCHDNTQVLVNIGPNYKGGEVNIYWLDWKDWMRSRGWRWFGWYIWDQGTGLPGDWHGRLAPCHEWIFHFNRQVVEPNRIIPCIHAGSMGQTPGMRSADGKRKDGQEAGARSGPPASFMVADHRVPDSIVRVHRASSQGIAHLHPAIYSVDFARKLIDIYSQLNQLIYDPFGGAMTTILAAEKSGRVGYASEIVPGYVAIGLERFAQAGFKPGLVR